MLCSIGCDISCVGSYQHSEVPWCHINETRCHYRLQSQIVLLNSTVCAKTMWCTRCILRIWPGWAPQQCLGWCPQLTLKSRVISFSVLPRWLRENWKVRRDLPGKLKSDDNFPYSQRCTERDNMPTRLPGTQV